MINEPALTCGGFGFVVVSLPQDYQQHTSLVPDLKYDLTKYVKKSPAELILGQNYFDW